MFTCRAGTFGGQDIVFNSSTNLWACCRGAGGRRDCAVPSIDKAFQAPSPADLRGTFRAPLEGQAPNYSSTSSTSSVLLASTTAVSETPLSPPSSTPASSESFPVVSSDSPSGLNAGQKAGIGVGGAIAWFALMGLLFWFWWRRRWSRKNAGFEAEKPSEGTSGISSNEGLPTDPAGPRELEARPDIMLDSKQHVELDSRARQEAGVHPRERFHELG